MSSSEHWKCFYVVADPAFFLFANIAVETLGQTAVFMATLFAKLDWSSWLLG